MPSKQKSGLYRTKVKIGVDAHGKDILKWISGKTKRELERARQDVIDYYISGVARETDKLFGAYAVEWFNTRKRPNISASSIESYRTALNNDILPVFGNRQLRAITPMELQSFINGFGGMSKTKIVSITSALRGVFRSACQDGILIADPTEHIAKPAPADAKEKRALTTDERARIETVCRTHPRGAYLAVMFYLGVRPGEARGLQWGDFDWANNLVHIQRDIDYKARGAAGELKTKSSNRTIPVPPQLREILGAIRGMPDMYLFTGEKSGQPLSKSTSERLWMELMAAAGLAHPAAVPKRYGTSDPRTGMEAEITPHYLRHNYITMCWENGIDVYTTMRLVGHKSITTTMNVYTHLSDKQMQRASDQVSDMFEKKVAQKLHNEKL